MNRFKCSRCDSEFYSANSLQDINCPYCGYAFKVFDQKRRAEERTSMQRDCKLSFDLKNLEAYTVDISQTGLGIKMAESAAVNKDDVLRVVVKDFDIDINAQVVWIKHYDSVVARAGLRFC